jgi:hypothetical protein|tara:strand:- start:5804 stop:6202 length:399 start_codon:yes stop_codon:yes gene_type:complete
MAVGDLTVAYSSYTVTLNQFSDDSLPRSVLGQASLEFSALGAGIADGPVKTQKKIWSVAAYATYTQCQNMLNLFYAWDAVRAQGKNSAQVSISDQTFGSTITASGFFTTPPEITRVGASSEYYLLSFGLTEV